MKVNYQLIVIPLLLIIGCRNGVDEGGNRIVTNEYKRFLPDEKRQSEMDKAVAGLPEDHEITDGITHYQSAAARLDKLFDQSGDVSYLNRAVVFREKAAAKAAIGKEQAYRALAQGYIKQHRFAEADSVMDLSRQVSDSRQNKYVAFDVSMETGDYETAGQLIRNLEQSNDQNYLIRAAKYADYVGNLDNTIDFMHQAEQLAESGGKPERMVWLYSNLGDYHGHNNELSQSYRYYLKTLEADPDNLYALRKIAYLLYAHEKDYQGAIDVIDRIRQINRSPDLDLMLSEIYAASGNSKQSDLAGKRFYDKVKTGEYGNMYNGYLIEYFLSEEQPEKAMELIEAELKNRRTPETYAWYANVLRANGEEEKALNIIEEYVAKKTFEPSALLISAKVYKAVGQTGKVSSIKDELNEAAFELGPVTMREVKSL